MTQKFCSYVYAPKKIKMIYMDIEALHIHKRSDVLIHTMWCIGLNTFYVKESDKKSHIVLTYLCEIPRINISIIHGNQFVITRVRGRGGLGNNCLIDEDSLGRDENALTLGRVCDCTAFGMSSLH